MATVTLEINPGEVVSRETAEAIFTYNPQQLAIRYAEIRREEEDVD